MNPRSHPETEERRDQPQLYACNQVLRERLLQLRGEPVPSNQTTVKNNGPQWSNNTIAKSLGVSPSMVSQYLSDEGNIYSGDVAALERKIIDFLDNQARRRASGVLTIAAGNTDEFRAALENIRKTADCGVIMDESGTGKSRAAELYADKNPTCIYFRTFVWNRTQRDAEKFMFSIAGRNGYDGQTKYAEHAVNRLRGSDRLIIVDDAHFLHHTALLWWVHFHEATQMPIAFCGVFELQKVVESDSQIFSRFGLKYAIVGKDAEGKILLDNNLVEHLINSYVPDANGDRDELKTLCQQVAREHGHYRSLQKQLKLAAELRAGSKARGGSPLSWPQAFRAAHTMLVRNYDLN